MSLYILLEENPNAAKVCESRKCRRKAAAILDVMNFSVNPCQDFYEVFSLFMYIIKTFLIRLLGVFNGFFNGSLLKLNSFRVGVGRL
jgi:hypothetical protein